MASLCPSHKTALEWLPLLMFTHNTFLPQFRSPRGQEFHPLKLSPLLAEPSLRIEKQRTSPEPKEEEQRMHSYLCSGKQARWKLGGLGMTHSDLRIHCTVASKTRGGGGVAAQERAFSHYTTGQATR